MKLFGCDHWKAISQVKAHLVPKYGDSACASPIGLFDALSKDFFHEIVILAHINIGKNEGLGIAYSNVDGLTPRTL